jgi:hypothetical protein
MKLILKKKGLTHCLSVIIATFGLSTGDAYAQKISTLKLLEPIKTVETAINPKIIKPVPMVNAGNKKRPAHTGLALAGNVGK